MRIALTLSLLAGLSHWATADISTPTAANTTAAPPPIEDGDVLPATGARIDDSADEIYLRVDPGYVPPKGKPVPPDAPLKTVQSAVNTALKYLERELPVRIGLANAVYRESVSIPGNSFSALLVIEGDSMENTVITGSEPFSDGWELVDADRNIWRHSWERDWGDYMRDQVWSKSTDPQSPQRLVSLSRPTSVLLNWEPPLKPEREIDSYRVYRRKVDGLDESFRLVADEVHGLDWEDRQLTPATDFSDNNYAYYVTAVDAWGKESRRSGIINSRARDPQSPGYTPATVRRRELLFVDGEPVRMVETTDELTNIRYAMTFLVNDGYLRDPTDGYLFLCLPAGKTPANVEIEAATNLNLGRKNASASLYVADKPNLVIRNLSISNSVLDGLRLDSCRNVLIEDVRAVSNGGNGIDINVERGLQIESQAITLRRVQANDNGACGINGSRLKNLLIEDSQTLRNNWRGAWEDYKQWDRAGLRLKNAHRGTLRRHRSEVNAAAGIWLDYNNREIRIEDCQFLGNIDSAGLFIKSSPGPVVIRDSLFMANDIGLLLRNSGNGLLEGCIFNRNTLAQIGVIRNKPVLIIDWETQREQMLNTNAWCWRENIFNTGGPDELVISAPYTDWANFYSTLTSTRNLWSLEGPENAVSLNQLRASFADWQMATGNDTDSLLADAKLTYDSTTKRIVPGPDSPYHKRASWPSVALPEGHRKQFETEHSDDADSYNDPRLESYISDTQPTASNKAADAGQ